MELTCNKSPLVSIIIPVYKAEKYIAACIESVLAQLCGDWELILVDDGSPDGSGRICDEYAVSDSRIIVIHKLNAGVSAARNDAIRIARGKYLCFIDSDDYVLPSYLSDMLAYESDVVVTGYVNRFTSPVREDEIRPIDGDKFYSVNDRSLADGLVDVEMDYRWAGPAAKLYLRSIINEHNLLFDETLNYGEDHLFNMEYGKYVESISFLDRFNYVYMHRDTLSLTNRQVPSSIMFSYIIKLYEVRKVYIETICKGNEKYKQFADKELVSYFWQTVYGLLNEDGQSNKDRVNIIHSTQTVLPLQLLYNRQYSLPTTYRLLRLIYRFLPMNIATLLSKSLILKK